jgi:hypothetical protein
LWSLLAKSSRKEAGMSGKKTFQKDESDSIISSWGRKFSGHRRKILVALILIVFFLPGWNRALPVTVSALTVPANPFDVPPQLRTAQVNDFDGDGITDFTIVRKEPTTDPQYEQLVWYIHQSSNQTPVYKWFGLGDDKIVSGDYDGDRITDAAVFRKGEWYVQKSSDGGLLGTHLGSDKDLPAEADYDGDGKTDFAVYQRKQQTWTVIQSSDQQIMTYDFNCSGCMETDSYAYMPVPADYDNDGKADPALMQSNWYANPRTLIIKKSSKSFTALPDIRSLYLPPLPLSIIPEGDGRDMDIPRDFNRDGHMDLAIVYGRTGLLHWMIFLSIGDQIAPVLSPNYTIHWGKCDDYPVAGDYQRNGFVDLAVWRPTEGNFYIRPTLNSNLEGGAMTVYHWGSSNDIPTALGGRVSCLPDFSH